jgi:transposase
MDILRWFMAGRKGQKKRFWSDDEKRSICAQTTVRGVSVAQVARRYAMNANLIHNWLKDPRFAPKSDINAVVDTDTGFLPVEITGAVAVPFVDEAPRLDVAVSADRVDITLSDGRRILVEGPTALSGVLALVEGLMA